MIFPVFQDDHLIKSDSTSQQAGSRFQAHPCFLHPSFDLLDQFIYSRHILEFPKLTAGAFCYPFLRYVQFEGRISGMLRLTWPRDSFPVWYQGHHGSPYSQFPRLLRRLQLPMNVLQTEALQSSCREFQKHLEALGEWNPNIWVRCGDVVNDILVTWLKNDELDVDVDQLHLVRWSVDQRHAPGWDAVRRLSTCRFRASFD